MMCRLDSPEMVQSSCLLKMQEKDSVNQLCVKNTYILKVLLPSVYLNYNELLDVTIDKSLTLSISG